MQQVNNDNMSILAILDRIQQGVTLPQQGKTESEFDKLMNQQVSASKPEESQKPQSQDKPAQETDGKETLPADTVEKPEEQMQQTALTWAAMSMVQAPVEFAQQDVNPQEVLGEQVVTQVLTVDGQTAPAVEVSVNTQTQAMPLEQQPQVQEAAVTAVPQQDVEAQPQVEAPVQLSQEPQVETQVQTVSGDQKPQMENQAQTDSQSNLMDENVEVVEQNVQTSQQVFTQVDTVPVKVSDVGTQQETTETADVETQVFQGVKEAVQQGENKLTLQLTPENLGTVTVELTRGADGALHVVLSAERMQTQGLLEKHMSGLQTLLAGSSQEPVEVQVQRQQEAPAYDNHPYDGSSGNGKGGQQQQEQDHRQQRQGADFLQQLRLGLIPVDSTLV